MSDMEVIKNFSLLEYNTFGIASVASQFVALHGSDDYRELIRSQMLKQGGYFILGGGSNVVLPDYFDGVIVHPANKGVRLLEQHNGQCVVEAEAGEVWADFVDYCIGQGWYGLENLAAIPGCVGAAPVQNVGAYGKEAKDFISRVHCFDIKCGEECWIEASDCGFGYRWSRFKGEWKDRFIIDRVVFLLSNTFVPDLSYRALESAVKERCLEQPTARQLADTVAAVRDSKLPNPNMVGSAGSFFKNPVIQEDKYEQLLNECPDLVAFPLGNGRYKLSAGWLIERCGWKGQTLGRVGVYEKQALVLVNRGGCSGDDVRRLADAVVSDVENNFGVHLECEAIFV